MIPTAREGEVEEARVEREPQTTRERAMLLLRATLVPGWLPTSGGQRLVWTIRLAILLGGLLLLGSAVDKPLWSWLQLLIVPAALAIGVAWLNWAQRKREREAEEAQQERERIVEEARRARELEVEDQRAQDAALQAYLSHMSQLLTDKDRPLLSVRPNDERRVLARARTLTLLAGLKGDNKWRVLELARFRGRVASTPQPLLLL
jgi:hypothetical protein